MYKERNYVFRRENINKLKKLGHISFLALKNKTDIKEIRNERPH